MISIKHILTYCGCHLLLLNASAQKGLNSIYSAYGIGDYKMRDQNAYLGMGNAGVAMPSQYSVNEMNPSSFAWLPKDNFRLEVTLGGLSTKYINENINTAAGDFTISRIALSMQVINPLRTVIGLRRFSQVEYYTTSTREIAGSTEKLSTSIEGNGGLYQVYAGNALLVGKNLALGVNAGFIFGSVNTKESVLLNDADGLISETNKYYNHGSVTAGLQYRIKSKKTDWLLGAFYEPQIRMNVLEESQLKNLDEAVIAEQDDVHSKFIYPQKYGAGISYTRHSFTATVDLIGHLWAGTGYKGNHFTTTDAYSISAGIRHQFTRTTIWGKSMGVGLHAGFNREHSYLVIDGNQVVSNAFTLGATFPSMNNLNFYSIGCKVGSRGVAVYPLVKENFFEFNFNFSFGGFFYKGKKYD